MEPASIQAYQALFESSGEPLLYSNPWWLDATCGKDGWNALITFDTDRKPQAGIPYRPHRIRGMSAITTPPLTQWVSFLCAKDEYGRENTFSFSGLPKTSILDLSVKPDQRIHLQDVSLAPALRYSFIIPRSDDMQYVRSRYNEGLRRNLKQAGQQHTIEESDHLARFLNLCQNTYQDKGMKMPSWFETVIPGVYHALIKNQCGSLTLAYAQGKVIAGILTAWDSHTSYYLAGGKVADEHATAAHALLLDQAIHNSCARGTAFDFEGSMHPGIANFFQSFGAIPVSYWHFKKYRGAGRLWSVLKK